MVVFSRKSVRRKAEDSLTSSRASSESPVFGVIGTLHRMSSLSPVLHNSGIKQSKSFTNDRNVIYTSPNKQLRKQILSTQNHSPTRRIGRSLCSSRSPISPLDDDVFNNSNHPTKTSPDHWSPAFTSSPTEKDVSPNRVVARKTIAYNPSASDAANITRQYKQKSSSLNRSYKDKYLQSLFSPAKYPKVTRSSEQLLDSNENSKIHDQRKSWSQKHSDHHKTGIDQRLPKTRNSYSVGNTKLSAFHPPSQGNKQ